MAMVSKVDKALEQVRRVLSAEKAPSLASSVHHEYRDKYLLAECMTNTTVASLLNCLSALGLSAEGIAQLRSWAATSAVSLKFRATETCAFDRTETKQVESATKIQRTHQTMGVETHKVTSSVVTTVTEHFYTFLTEYELMVVRGAGRDPGDCLRLLHGGGSQTLVSTSKTPPRPEVRDPAAEYMANISWLFRHLQPEAPIPAFLIDRSHAKCHTPRRNPDVDTASSMFAKVMQFFQEVRSYVTSYFHSRGVENRQLDLSALNADSIFVPCLPILDGKAEERSGQPDAGASAALQAPAQAGVVACLPSGAVPAGSALLSTADNNALLTEEMATMASKKESLAAAFPSDDSVASFAEAFLIVVSQHCHAVCSRWVESLDFIEVMMTKQLIAAIGKEVKPADFAEYMRYHNAKLFRPAFAPIPFCYAVRRSVRHSPEGTVSIEQALSGGGDSNVPLPIETIAAKSTSPHPMTFKLGAATEVTFDGDKFLHAWLDHRFSGQSGSALTLVLRARQFCSMLVMVGRISSATSFDPTYAAIVQNKDELTLPLEMSTIPTPKEFKDAIESLSPEQQAFAKAFRSMQLEGTLFGILVIQIKPQLEKVLNLQPDSLTKEIKLTQDLMQLFIKYHIPSDLLSFQEDAVIDGMDVEMVAPTGAERLAAVKAHVEAIHKMIAQSKEEELQARKMEAQFQKAGKGPPPPAGKGAPPMMFGKSAAKVVQLQARSRAMPQMVMMECVQSAEAGAGEAMDWGSPASPVPPVPAPPAAAQQQQPNPQPNPQPNQQRDEGAGGGAAATGSGDVEVRDYTQVPKEMDRQFELLDTDAALRPTKIAVGPEWTKKAQQALLVPPEETRLSSDGQKKEKDAAFDLLDALTKSGGLSLQDASLHILVAATHCFDKAVTETVIQDNMNPIEKVERSMLIMANTVHQKPVAALVGESHRERVTTASPQLFLTADA